MPVWTGRKAMPDALPDACPDGIREGYTEQSARQAARVIVRFGHGRATHFDTGGSMCRMKACRHGGKRAKPFARPVARCMNSLIANGRGVLGMHSSQATLTHHVVRSPIRCGRERNGAKTDVEQGRPLRNSAVACMKKPAGASQPPHPEAGRPSRPLGDSDQQGAAPLS
ncbi:hypothetical protein VTI28DRAFT_9898 [Corynascus sepedonium]